jgi:hypothetical protein
MRERYCTVFGEFVIILISTHTIGVAFHSDSEARMAQNDSGNLGEFLACTRLQRVLAGVEQHIGHVHDQSARCVAGLKDGVELSQ